MRKGNNYVSTHDHLSTVVTERERNHCRGLSGSVGWGFTGSKRSIGWGIVPYPLFPGVLRKRHVIYEFQDNQGYTARPCPNHVMWALYLYVNR